MMRKVGFGLFDTGPQQHQRPVARAKPPTPTAARKIFVKIAQTLHLAAPINPIGPIAPIHPLKKNVHLNNFFLAPPEFRIILPPS